MTTARREKISIVIPMEESSKGIPLAVIDWDNALTKSNFDYEIIAAAHKDSNVLSALRAGFRSSVANLKFSSSETAHLHDIINTAVNSTSGEFITLASPEVFPTVSDLSSFTPVLLGESDIVFSTAHGPDKHLSEALCRLFSPVGSREFAEGIISAHKETIIRLMPVIKMFPNNIFEALAIASKKLGLNISESMLSASVTPGLPTRTPSAKVISSLRTRISFELAWGGRGLPISKKVY